MHTVRWAVLYTYRQLALDAISPLVFTIGFSLLAFQELLRRTAASKTVVAVVSRLLPP